MTFANVSWTGAVLLLLIAVGSSTGRTQPVADSVRQDTAQVPGRLEPLLDSFGSTDQSVRQLSERFSALANNPLKLNQASATELSFLPGLSSGQAHQIVRHRTEHGPFEKMAELQALDGITSATVRSVSPFLTVASSSSAGANRVFPSLQTITSNLEFDVIQRFTRRLDLGRGYREGRFLGPPGRLTSRVRLNYKRRLQLALTLDKDPGEPIRWAPSTDTYGFDHVTGSLALQDLGIVETLVLGDFSVQFGQGVAMWQGIRFGKGRDPVSPVLRSGRGISAYKSASESGFFRGAGITLAPPENIVVTGFASRRLRDASLDSSAVRPSPSGPVPARTLSGGGRHRTSSELARKGTFGETTIGGAVEYRSPSLHVGLNGYWGRFDRPLRPGDKAYRRFRVSGRQTSMVSLYSTAYWGDYILFGEVARSAEGVLGGVAGAALDEGETVRAVLLGRSYPAQLSTFHGNAFGESSGAQNEVGVYTGVQVRVAENWRIGAYFDQYRFPWLRFNVPRPSTGWETRAVLEYTPRPWLSTYLQLRTQSEEEGTEYSDTGGRVLEGMQKERRYSARWHTEYVFSDALTLRTRLEVSRHSTPEQTSNGIFLSQGLRLTPTPSLQIDARVAFFDTEGYPARIYAYEHDLLYSFSVPVFFDQGRRSYILAEYEPASSLTLELKYGITRYTNRSTIGSGLNQVDGQRRREVRAQVRWEL